MNESAFENMLSDLVNEINSIPDPQKARLVKLVEKTQECHKQLKKSVNSLQDSLDYLRVSIKYILFDLEATRRENSYLKKIIEESK